METKATLQSTYLEIFFFCYRWNWQFPFFSQTKTPFHIYWLSFCKNILFGNCVCVNSKFHPGREQCVMRLAWVVLSHCMNRLLHCWIENTSNENGTLLSNSSSLRPCSRLKYGINIWLSVCEKKKWNEEKRAYIKMIRIGRFCASGRSLSRIWISIHMRDNENCDFTQRKHIVSHSTTKTYYCNWLVWMRARECVSLSMCVCVCVRCIEVSHECEW